MKLTGPFVCISAVLVLACNNSTRPDLRTGMWGGTHVGLSVEDTRVIFLFDCAAGEVDSKISFAADRRFDVTGTFNFGGNISGGYHSPHAARYFGRIVELT